MKYLIDTHILIWYIEGNKNLTAKARRIIDNNENTIYVSKVSLWEMAIKISLKKLKIAIPFIELEDYLIKHGFTIADFDFQSLNVLIDLPFKHNDPFDRLLIAQSISDNIQIITIDKSFKKYPVNIIW